MLKEVVRPALLAIAVTTFGVATIARNSECEDNSAVLRNNVAVCTDTERNTIVNYLPRETIDASLPPQVNFIILPLFEENKQRIYLYTQEDSRLYFLLITNEEITSIIFNPVTERVEVIKNGIS